VVWAQEKVDTPVLKVGDKYTYRFDNGIEWTIENISNEKDLFISARTIPDGQYKGKQIIYLDKKDLSCVKVVRDGKEDREERGRLKQFYNFPLFSGKKWSYRYSSYNTAWHRDSDILAEFSAIRFEDVEVPAGKFRAFKVMVNLSIKDINRRGTYYYWWGPDVRSLIKWETDGSDFWKRQEYQKYELISFELK
jgi:hypothetical protein